MTKVAVIEKCPSSLDMQKFFPDTQLEVFYLSSVPVKKLLKVNIDLVGFDPVEWDYVILVGSEACKVFCKTVSVSDSSGHLVDGKFIPLVNPAVAIFKPEAKDGIEKALNSIRTIFNGTYNVGTEGEWEIISEVDRARQFLAKVRASGAPIIALDTEATALYPRDGYILGMSLSYKKRQGVYILSDALDDRALEQMQELIDTREVVFHNSKFDMKFMQYHFGLTFRTAATHDTLVLHYLLDETQGSHGLKTLALKFTNYGDYDKDLETFKAEYCRTHGLKREDFNYGMIPLEVIGKYACIDTAVTLELFELFAPKVLSSPKLGPLYRGLMMPGVFSLTQVEEYGIPISKDRLDFADEILNTQLAEAKTKLYSYKELIDFEEANGGIFNPNSVVQLRKLLFDWLQLKPTGKMTATNAHSTDAEVLEALSSQHPIVECILKIRKLSKVLNTYVVKLRPEIDRDGRVRTGFGLTTTTSGRLSSSGKFNAQQILRDDPIVKGCIKARKGYKIISQDLKTAEVYYAAVLSGDKELAKVFEQDGDLHSVIAKMVFGLDCPVDMVKKLHPELRQAAKAITFGILYGSGPNKVAEVVGCTLEEAKEYISVYFSKFKRLKKWLAEQKDYITTHGYVYTAFGRKRRLRNVFSTDKAISSHEVRSGINALIQSVASDVNLFATIDVMYECKTLGIDAKVFMLVHDSIVAEVREDQVTTYCNVLKRCTQKDRGVTLNSGVPVGVDQSVSDDYSDGHFDEVYGARYQEYLERLAA